MTTNERLALRYRCHACRALPGQQCRTGSGTPTSPHRPRVDRARIDRLMAAHTFEQLESLALLATCPNCHARRHERCMTPAGRATIAHQARIDHLFRTLAFQ